MNYHKVIESEHQSIYTFNSYARRVLGLPNVAKVKMFCSYVSRGDESEKTFADAIKELKPFLKEEDIPYAKLHRFYDEDNSRWTVCLSITRFENELSQSC